MIIGASGLTKKLPLRVIAEPVSQLYRRSLLILNTQIDWQGGITAANDSDILQICAGYLFLYMAQGWSSGRLCLDLGRV